MKRLYVALLFFFWLTNSLQAQDPAFSQLFNNRMYLNPAFTGIDQGHRLSAATRSLWRNLPNNFNTQLLTYDYKPCSFPRIGVGLLAMRNTEGDGFLRSTEVGGTFAFHTPYGKRTREGSFSFAVQASYINRNIDWDKLVFGDQLDPVLGVISPRTSQAALDFQGVNRADFAGGFLLRQRLFISKKLDMTFHLGAAVHHITTPNVSLVQRGNPNGSLPLKYTLHGGLLIPIGKKIGYLIPAMRFINQDGAPIHNIFDANLMYLKNKFFGGVSYRFNQFRDYPINTDAAIFFVGYEFEFSREADLRLTYSFDTNFKGVSGGDFYTHEVSVVFSFAKKCENRIGRINKNICDYEGKGLPKIF